MKHLLTILLVCAGVAMLITGYTAPQRAEANAKAHNKLLESVSRWVAEQKGKDAAEKSARDFDYQKMHAETDADRLLSKIDELAEKQGESLESSREKMCTFLEEESYKQRGVVQYCTGWLLLAAAAIVGKLEQQSKIDHAT